MSYAAKGLVGFVLTVKALQHGRLRGAAEVPGLGEAGRGSGCLSALTTGPSTKLVVFPPTSLVTVVGSVPLGELGSGIVFGHFFVVNTCLLPVPWQMFPRRYPSGMEWLFIFPKIDFIYLKGRGKHVLLAGFPPPLGPCWARL